LQPLIRLYLSRCNIVVVNNKGTVVILQKPYSRGLLVLIVDCKVICMQLQLRNSNTSLLSALYSNYKRIEQKGIINTNHYSEPIIYRLILDL
jgi:hypothetical protein